MNKDQRETIGAIALILFLLWLASEAGLIGGSSNGSVYYDCDPGYFTQGGYVGGDC